MKPVLEETGEILAELGVSKSVYRGGGVAVRSPVTGEVIGKVRWDQEAEVSEGVQFDV